jgi:hypothetical protein
MGMRKHTINMGNERINTRKKHMIGFIRHEILGSLMIALMLLLLLL